MLATRLFPVANVLRMTDAGAGWFPGSAECPNPINLTMQRKDNGMRTKAVVVDQHVCTRQMLAAFLVHEGNFDVVGEAGTGIEAMKVCRKSKPGLVILELMLPEMCGVDVITQLREADGEVRVLVFSSTTNQELILSALRARPHGFVRKQDSLATFRDALHAVMGGCSFFTPFATSLQDRTPNPLQPIWGTLNSRERAILQMVAEGHGNKQMADRLGISCKMVERFRSRLMQKLGLHDVAALTVFAIRQGLVSIE